MKRDRITLGPAAVSEIIGMALSNDIRFDTIRHVHGLSPDDVKALMRWELKPASYRAWRKRIERFGSGRAHYK
jgi:uncharacterized protein (TIGR03643 family)